MKILTKNEVYYNLKIIIVLHHIVSRFKRTVLFKSQIFCENINKFISLFNQMDTRQYNFLLIYNT